MPELSGKPNTMLWCSDCGAEFSANPDDYILSHEVYGDDIFECPCGGTLIEVTKKTQYVPLSEPLDSTEHTVDAELYRRALRKFSLNRYVVYSASNQFIDTDHLMPGDIVLSDNDSEEGEIIHDPRRIHDVWSDYESNRPAVFTQEILDEAIDRAIGAE